MDEKFKLASLQSIAGGEAIAQFDFQLNRAIENCLDVNTEAKAKRQVVLKVTILPTEDRKSAMVTFNAEAKLPGDRPGIEQLHFAKNEAFVNTAHQMTFDDFVKANSKNVIEFDDAEQGE